MSRRIYNFQFEISKLILLIVLTLLVLTLFSIEKISASSYNVFINEFLPDATGSDAGKEWIELFNTSDQPLDISGYKIKTTSNSSGTVRQSILPAGTILEGNSFLTISESAILFPGSIDLSSGGLNMYNSDAVISLENSSGNTLFSANYGTSVSGRSWELPGPLFGTIPECTSPMSIHAISDSRNSANSNENTSCWEDSFEILNIIFSSDNQSWNTTFSSEVESEVFLAYEISDNMPIESEVWQLDDGSIISSPAILSDYQNRIIKLFLTVNGKTYEKWSEPIYIASIEEEEQVFLEKIEFSLDNINWSESITAESEITIFFRFNFNKEVEIDSVKWSDSDYIEITNPFATSDYYNKSIKLEVISDGILYELPSEPIFILKPEELNYTIQITEIYPSPDATLNEYEWIEIYNYGNEAIDLTGLYFKDKGSGSSEYGSKSLALPNYILKSHEYYLIQVPSGSVTLNNSGDTITLFAKDGNILDKVSYVTTAKGSSQNRRLEVGEYLPKFSPESIDIPLLIVSELITPVAENQFPQTEVTIEGIVTINVAKTLTKGSRVNLEGIITVPQGVLEDDIFYIQDETGGIKIDLPAEQISGVVEGQRIRVKGEISEANGELKVNIGSLEDLIFTDENGQSLGTSEVFFEQSINDFEVSEGQMLYLEGSIIENYSTSFDIETIFGIIRVSIDSDTDIDIGQRSIGDEVHVFGVFNQYNDTYRIQPRYQSDINIIAKPKPQSTKKSSTSSKKSTKQTIVKSSKPPSVSSSPDISIHQSALGINTAKNLINSPASQKTVIYLWPVYTLGSIVSSLGVAILNMKRSDRLEFRDRVEKVFGI